MARLLCGDALVGSVLHLLPKADIVMI